MATLPLATLEQDRWTSRSTGFVTGNRPNSTSARLALCLSNLVPIIPPGSAGPCMFNTTDGSAVAPLWISRRGNHKPHVAIDCYIRSDRGFLTLLLEAMTKLELAAVYPEGGTIVFPLALSQHISLHLPPGMEPRPVSNADELAIALGCL